MDLNDLQRKLFAQAKLSPPADTVPYAFEKRIMARLEATPRADGWLLWGRALWRGAAACAAVSILLSVWAVWPSTSNEPATLESTVFAAAEQPSEVW